MSCVVSLGQWVIERAGLRVLEMPMSARLLRIGSDESNDIVLEDTDVAPLAAIVSVDDAGEIWLRTLGQDGADPREEPVRFGSAFELGAYVLSYVQTPRRTQVQATRRLSPEDEEAAPLRLELPSGAREIPPGTPAVSLGRDESNGVVIDHDVISGFHCELRIDGHGWRIFDLGSTNGTFLDGVRIETARLPPSGTLMLGDLQIPFGPRKVSTSAETFHGLVGRSSAMQAVFRQIEVIAPLDEPVLIRGETGTGKELVASALHAASARAKGRFLARNCGAMPEGLADAELFGSMRGAFSGALDKAGVFEGAAGGTVFLDELGELPLPVQPKLLRALQEKRVRRLGELADKPVDFRLLAATHRDLEAMVRSKSFREDLLHRVSVFTIELPPLRERGEDVPLLAGHLLGATGPKLTPAAAERLMDYRWPGNVRELRNVLIRASAFRKGPMLDVEDLRLPSLAASKAPAKRRDRRSVSLEDESVRAETRAVWEECGRSVSRAAARLGIAKSTMHRRKEVYGLPDPET